MIISRYNISEKDKEFLRTIIIKTLKLLRQEILNRKLNTYYTDMLDNYIYNQEQNFSLLH